MRMGPNTLRMLPPEPQDNIENYGAARTQCDGAVDEEGLGGTDPFKSGEAVPHCFHSMGGAFYEELLHSYIIVGVINMSENDGIVPEVCVQKHIPCVSVCFFGGPPEAAA